MKIDPKNFIYKIKSKVIMGKNKNELDRKVGRIDGLEIKSYLLEERNCEIVRIPINEKDIKGNSKRILLRKGHKEYDIDGILVLALNEKNAIRKVQKIKNNN